MVMMKPAIGHTSCVTLTTNQLPIHVRGGVQGRQRRTGELESDNRGVRELRGKC